MQDRPRFAATINRLCAVFGKEPTEPLLDGYWLALGNLEPRILESACGRAIIECKFMPTPAAIRELAGLSLKAESATAWEIVLTAIRQHGPYRPLDFGPLVNKCIRGMGGWVRLCDVTGEQLHTWARKQFLELYEAFSATPQSGPKVLDSLHPHEAVRVVSMPGRPALAIVERKAIAGGKP